jgi:ABC-type Fe3+-hydroxamate transport system substrate-binding protein
VAVVGLREQDALLALGVVPVATTEWYGEHPGAIFPWAKEELGDAEPPTVLSYRDGIEVEKVAATRPDVIIGVYSGMTKKEYETLSRLAPVIAQPKGEPDYGSAWQEETLIAGEAVGKPDEAQKLVDETERLIADAAAANPGFAGQRAAVVSDYQGCSSTARPTFARASSSSSASSTRARCAMRFPTSSAASSQRSGWTRSTSARSCGSPTAIGRRSSSSRTRSTRT